MPKNCTFRDFNLVAIKSTLNGTQNSGDPLLNNTVHTPEDELQNVNVQVSHKLICICAHSIPMCPYKLHGFWMMVNICV